MNRRSFFALLGLAPVASVLGKAAVEPVTITLQGDSYSKESVEELLRSINDAVERKP